MPEQECINSKLYRAVWGLFLVANSNRNTGGYTKNIGISCIRNNIVKVVDTDFSEDTENDEEITDRFDCLCSDGESCPICETPDLKTIEEYTEEIKNEDSLDRIGELLGSTKKEEFIALASASYAGVGDKPFMIEPDKIINPPEKELKDAAVAFFEYIQSFLDENDVKINEIEDAFDIKALKDLAEKLSSTIENDIYNDLYKDVMVAEEAIRRIFRRANVIQEYMEVMRDITNFPIGVMWASSSSIKKTPTISKKGLSCAVAIQSDAFRVDPRHAWFTGDWKHNKQGTAAFRRELLSQEDLNDLLIKSKGKTSSDIKCVLENDYKTRIPMLNIFDDEVNGEKMHHDCLIMRGYIKYDYVKEYIDIKCNSDTVLCEVWLCGTSVVRVIELPEALDMGVFTTNFRRYDDGIYGYSLDNLLYPFITFYQSVIRGISKSAGKNTGSLITIDNAVVDNWTQYLDIIDGQPVLDTTADNVIEFNSTDAESPNWRGVPIDIVRFPTDLPSLIPLLDLIEKQLEKITGIPSFLTQQSSLNSALRTEEMLNMVNEANSKTVKSMLDNHENRILRKVIEWFFYTSADNIEFSELFLQSSPRILLGSEITTEFNSDRRLVTNIRELTPILQGTSQETLKSLFNDLAREVYGMTDDIIEVDKFNTRRDTAVAPSSVAPSSG